jgi:uncharacterized protein
MKRWNAFALVWALAAWLVAGCGNSPSSPTSGGQTAAQATPGSAPIDPTEPRQAQPKLSTIKVYVGAAEVVAEQAVTADQLRTGMMFRTQMGENEGMIFAMPFTRQAGFWMKNCPLSLSAAYIDPDGVIQEIHELKSQDTNTVLSASDSIRFVLEMPPGWFEKHGIRPGVAVATERGSLMQTYFGRR